MRTSFQLLCTVFVLFLGYAAASTSQDDTDLICHTSDPSECYPRIFVPTDEFQIVHDDQAIPKGLHIRMDFQTGQKEAKLYDASKDTDPVNAVEVTRESSDDDAQEKFAVGLSKEQQIIDEMRRDKLAGRIKPPPGSSGDAEKFAENTAALKKVYEKEEPSAVDIARSAQALDELEDLCHDMYWGLQLVKDTDLLHQIYNSITLQDSRRDVQSKISLLAAALQNNEAALNVFYKFVDSKEGHSKFMNHLSEAMGKLEENVPSLLSHYVSLISKLLLHDHFLADFVSGDGLRKLALTVVETKINSSDTQRFNQKAANLVEDHIIGHGARDRFIQVHAPLLVSHEFQDVPNALRKVLANRVDWCWILNTAFTVWMKNPEYDQSILWEGSRYEIVPDVCDSSRYDVQAGTPLKDRTELPSAFEGLVHNEL